MTYPPSKSTTNEKLRNLRTRIRAYGPPFALVLWVIGLVYGFWFYEMRYYLPATKPAGAATLSAEHLPISPLAALATSSGTISLINSGHPVLINFWNPACPCSRFMERHVQYLLGRYGAKRVQFITVVVHPVGEMSTSECAAQWLGRGFSTKQMPYLVDVDDSISRRFGVWAAPAAVILDSTGRVQYIGAYNVSRYCDNSDTAFAQKALEDIVAGKSPKIRTLPFYGCQITAQAVTPHVQG
jgi:hypothetical protein